MLIKPVFKVLDVLQVPRLLEFILHLLVNVTRLTAEELEAAGQVLGTNAIDYSAERVGEGRLLPLYFMINRDRATTLFHTILLPSKGRHARGRPIYSYMSWSMCTSSRRSAASTSGRLSWRRWELAADTEKWTDWKSGERKARHLAGSTGSSKARSPKTITMTFSRKI